MSGSGTINCEPSGKSGSLSGLRRSLSGSLKRKTTSDSKREDKQRLKLEAQEPEEDVGMLEGADSDGETSSTGTFESQERPYPLINYRSLYFFRQMTFPRNLAIKMVC